MEMFYVSKVFQLWFQEVQRIKDAWTSLQEAKRLTESSLKEKVTKGGDCKVQTAHKVSLSVVLFILCYSIFPKQNRRQDLSSLYSKCKSFQNDTVMG